MTTPKKSPKNWRRPRRKRKTSLRGVQALKVALSGLSLCASIFLTGAIASRVLGWFCGNSQAKERKAPVKHPANNPRQILDLFTSSESVGAIAIGHAEGNLMADGTKTESYYGHADNANNRRNIGWCSYQKEASKNARDASLKCVDLVQSRLPILLEDMEEVGLAPAEHPEVFVNLVDLWIQASPWVSEQFPQKYTAALELGKRGDAALLWARVESFRRDRHLDASGLLRICRRERRGLSNWECIAADQQRRMVAIKRVLHRDPTK